MFVRNISLVMLFTASVSLAGTYQPATGDHVRCLDDVSGNKYDIFISDAAKKQVILFESGVDGQIRYGSGSDGMVVKLIEKRKDLEFRLLNQSRLVGGIVLEGSKLNSAYYYDNGDSRVVECKLLTNRPIALLSGRDVRNLVEKPETMKNKLHWMIIKIAKDPRMKVHFIELEDKIKESGRQAPYIQMSAFLENNNLEVFFFGEADDRGSTQYEFVVKANLKTPNQISFGNVELINHP